MAGVELLAPLLGLAGVLIGAFVAWKAARDVSERDARRKAYAAYIAAVDQYGQSIIRDARTYRAVEPERLPDAGVPNAALSGLLVLGTQRVAASAHDMQQCLSDLSGAAVTGTFHTDQAAWQKIADRYWTLRADLIETARKETGAPALARDFLDRTARHTP